MVSLSETCRGPYQNKVEKECISLVFIIRIYHDARSSECQNLPEHFTSHIQQHGTKCECLECEISDCLRHGMASIKVEHHITKSNESNGKTAWHTLIFRLLECKPLHKWDVFQSEITIVSYLMLPESSEHKRTGYHSDAAAAACVSQTKAVQIPLADQRAQYMLGPVPEIHSLNTYSGNADWQVSYMHIGNTNIGITSTRLPRLYMWSPNKQFPCVIIINILQIVFNHSTMITWIF